MLHDYHSDTSFAGSRHLAPAGKKRPAPSEEEDDGAAETLLEKTQRRILKRQKRQ